MKNPVSHLFKKQINLLEKFYTPIFKHIKISIFNSQNETASQFEMQILGVWHS